MLILLILFISVGKNSLVKFKFSLRKVFRHSFKFLLQKKLVRCSLSSCVCFGKMGCCPHYLNIHSGKNVIPNISSSLLMSMLSVVNVVCRILIVCAFSLVFSVLFYYIVQKTTFWLLFSIPLISAVILIIFLYILM